MKLKYLRIEQDKILAVFKCQGGKGNRAAMRKATGRKSVDYLAENSVREGLLRHVAHDYYVLTEEAHQYGNYLTKKSPMSR
jgi:hypothetical protein